MKVALKNRILVSVIIFLYGQIAFSCPCGCGAAGPLQLSQGESWKFQLSATREIPGKYVMQNGRAGEDDGPETIDTLSPGFAAAVTKDVSVSLQAPVHRNFHSNGGSEYSAGDPSLGVRFTVFSPGLRDHLLPVVQLHGTYKHAVAKGVIEKPDRPHRLDIHGNGVSEIIPGVDFLFSHESWSAVIGVAALIKRSYVAEDPDGRSEKRTFGPGDRESLSVGYTFFGTGQIQLQYERDATRENKRDGKKIPDSDSHRNTIGLIGSLRVGNQKTLSFSFKESGTVFSNKNVSQTRSFGISYSVAI